MGIQGTGKNADICCAADCTCACGGDVPDNEGKDCFLTQIRQEPPGKCTGAELNAACVLDPEPIAGAPCGTVNGVVVDGVLDDDGMLCCPAGCVECGGNHCSTMPMSWVMPDPQGGPLAVHPDVAPDATSGDFCCMGVMDTLTAVCGVDGAVAPCRMPQDLPVKTDTCGVSGIEGTAHAGGQMCCSLGCDICGSYGCGEQHLSEVMPGDLPWSTTAPEGAKTSDYCCTDAFADDLASQDRFCGDEGVEPPCLIRSATLPPREGIVDSCHVDGMEGIANGDKCCPLGCGQCGGTGCGTIDMGYVTPTLHDTPPFGAKSSTYCCSGTTTFTAATPVCDAPAGSFPPCYIPDGITAAPAPTPPVVSGTPAPVAPAAPVAPVAPDPIMEDPGLPNTCNLPGMPGVLDATGSRCCPQGCGMCGGTGCGKIDMIVIAPTVYGGVPDDAKAGDYCCLSGVDERNVVCGTGDPVAHPPCIVPAALTQDTCNVEGVEGIASDNREDCCPLGCGQCGGEGCGAVPESQIFPDGRELPVGATASDYCCSKAFVPDVTLFCDEAGAEPPCFIPEGTPTRPPVITPSPMGTDSVDSSDDNGDGSATPSPVDGEDKPMGATPAPSMGATPAPSMAMTSCKNVFVMIEDAEVFDGVYVMDMDNELLFVKNDTSAVMMYVPHDEHHMDMDMDMDDANSTATPTVPPTTMPTVNSTTLESAMNSTMNSTMTSEECGYWVLLTMDANFTTSDFPAVGVQDCATNPEDIDPMAMWMVQHKDNETAVAGVGVVECQDPPMTPSPVTPSPPSAGGNGGATPSPVDGSSPPVTHPPAVDHSPAPETPPVVDVAPPTTVRSGSGNSKGLSTGEAVGVGVGVSAVAIVGGVALARWAKAR
eukprot:g8221.t1